MKKQLPIQIDIPRPCSQDWDEMTPQGQGRHCDSCNKTVIDFSSWSDTELFSFFNKNTAPVCGRYLESQLRRPIVIPYQPHSRLYRMAVAMGLTLLFVHGPEVRAQSRPPIVATDSLISELKGNKTDSSTSEIRGTVTDDKKEPLVNATVQILQNRVLKGATLTDFDGRYSIKGLDSGSYDIQVSYVGYKTAIVTKVSIASSFIVLDFKLDMSRKYVMGERVVIIQRDYPLIDKFKDSYKIRPKW